MGGQVICPFSEEKPISLAEVSVALLRLHQDASLEVDGASARQTEVLGPGTFIVHVCPALPLLKGIFPHIRSASYSSEIFNTLIVKFIPLEMAIKQILHVEVMPWLLAV